MKQKRPKSVNEAMLEMKSFLVTSCVAQVKTKEEDTQPTLIVPRRNHDGHDEDHLEKVETSGATKDSGRNSPSGASYVRRLITHDHPARQALRQPSFVGDVAWKPGAVQHKGTVVRETSNTQCQEAHIWGRSQRSLNYHQQISAKGLVKSTEPQI